jgi:tetratricopeptide (TPR) repeat protein
MRLLLLALAAALAPQSVYAARTPLQTYLAGDFSLALRDYSSASGYFGAALAATPNDNLLRRRTFELALTSGNFDRALRLAQDLIKSDKAISSANQLMAMDAIRRKDWTSASKILSQMPDVGIDAVVVPLLKSWTAVGQNDLIAARKALETLERGGSMSVLRQHQLAWIAIIGGDTATARSSLAELTKTPQLAGTNNLIAYASLMSQAGDRDGALKLLRFDEADRLPTAVVTAIESLQSGKTLGLPLRTPQQGLATALSIVATELSREGIKGAAVNLAHYAVWLAPDQPELRLSLADILSDAERSGEARYVLDAIPVAFSTELDVVIARARVLAQSERYDDAAKMLEQAITTQPKRVVLHTALGDALRGGERFEAAAAAYSQAISLQSQPLADASWNLFFARGIAYERLKMWDKTESDLKQALALRPDDPTLLNYLGYSWLDQKRNIPEATKMIERALELRPGDGAIIDSLGWAHFIGGQTDKAIELLEQAIAAVPGDPTVNEHLGDAYWSAGRTIEARHRWAAALESDPEKDQQARITNKIEFGLTEFGLAGPQSSRS